jgi:regulator of protease activity HflC (stomatin/prohibitin superfamily)
MKKGIAIAVSAVLAVVVAVFCIICLTRIKVGYVGVVYSAKGVEQNTLTQGWHWLSPLKHVKQFPVSQQQIVFSDDPSDYNTDEHADWHIDATANGGMVGINLTVNYNFLPDRVVSLYEKFNGMDGEAIVEGRVQNSIIAYVKEVTPRFSVMDIYSDKKSEVNKAITDYLNEKLSTEYGINVSSALIIDVELDSALQEKVRAKEQAKQDAEIAELAKQTAEAQAETNRVIAESEAAVKIIEAEAEAESNKTIAESITPELIQMKEAEARLKHGWVTVQGADTVVTAK